MIYLSSLALSLSNPSVDLPIWRSDYLTICTSIYLSIYIYIYMSIYLSIYLSIYRSIYLSIDLPSLPGYLICSICLA